jgi:hypothetical protein
MADCIGMGPQIKLVDADGRTVCVFDRLPASEATQMEILGNVVEIAAMEERWMAMQKPHSRKGKGHIDAEVAAHGIWIERRELPHPVRGDSNSNPLWLELPGLTLGWKKVTRVLDKLAKNGVPEITVEQLRKYA